VSVYTCLYRIDDATSEQDHAMAERYKLSCFASRISSFEKDILGLSSMGPRISGREFREHHGRDDSGIYRRTRGGTDNR